MTLVASFGTNEADCWYAYVNVLEFVLPFTDGTSLRGSLTSEDQLSFFWAAMVQ